MDEDYHSIESQLKRIEQQKKLDKIKNDDNSYKDLDCHWHLDKKDIDFNKLPEGEPLFIKNSEYEIFIIYIEELLGNMFDGAKTTFSVDNLWDEEIHTNTKISRVILNWQNSKKLVPISLNFENPKMVLIQDGNHRLSVSIAIGCKKIPVIIAHKYLDSFYQFFKKHELVKF